MPISIRLQNEQVIENCVAKVLYFCSHDRSYDTYDKIAIPQDNELHPLDIYIANNINAGIQREHFLALWDRRFLISEKLSRIPSDLNLSADDFDEVLWGFLNELFDACRSHDIGSARITKILHKKRPLLIPLIDNKIVVQKYFRENIETINTETMVRIAKSIREDVRNNLRELCNTQEAVGENGINLPLLRIFDMLLWEHYHPT